jgi:hypothetical protein
MLHPFLPCDGADSTGSHNMFDHRTRVRKSSEASIKARSDKSETLSVVIAGLVPEIPIVKAQLCLPKQDGRDKPGHDELIGFGSKPL